MGRSMILGVAFAIICPLFANADLIDSQTNYCMEADESVVSESQTKNDLVAKTLIQQDVFQHLAYEQPALHKPWKQIYEMADYVPVAQPRHTALVSRGRCPGYPGNQFSLATKVTPLRNPNPTRSEGHRAMLGCAVSLAHASRL